MSNIMIYNIVGTGFYIVPTNDTDAQNATTGFRTLLLAPPGVSGLEVPDSRHIRAWVIDSMEAGHVEGARTLACFISSFTYNGKTCPNSTEVAELTAAIDHALKEAKGDGTITSVGAQEVNLFGGGTPSP